jgi:hypothetical protein
MENKHASLAVVIVLSLASYSVIEYYRCKALEKALGETEAGYAEFMNKTAQGKKLYEFINPNTVGTFRIGDASYACGQLNTPLPILPRRK